jgi:hypothetical protein
MIDTSRRAATLLASMAAAAFAVAQPAVSQGPTDAQRAAIKSQCRSDYIAHCSSITPGGAAALQCLQKNMASLSGGCQSAVRAVEASVEKSEPNADAKTETTTESKPDAKPEAAPAAATAKPAAEPATTAAKPEPAPAAAAAPAAKSTATTTTAAKPAASAMTNKPSDAQIAAIRRSCRSDYPKVCAGVPTGGAPALQCLEKNKSKLSAGCTQAVAAAGGGAAAPTAAAASGTEATASSGTPATPPLVLRPMRPREVLFVVRSACGADVRALCAGVDPGGGRIIECLATQSASLSPDCRSVLGRFAAR